MNRGDVDFSFETFLKKFNEILDKHAPYKKLSIQKVKRSKKILDNHWNTQEGHQGKRPSEKNKFGKEIKIVQKTIRENIKSQQINALPKILRNK